jgi:hypothetical protein
MKNMNAERIRIRSSQSDFSRAVISCLEVSMNELRVSCVCDVARNVAVDSSKADGQCQLQRKMGYSHLASE